MPDRAPFVGFANNAYVMPAGLGGGLPITSVDADTAELKICRIGDRGVAAAVCDGIFQETILGGRVINLAGGGFASPQTPPFLHCARPALPHPGP